MSTTTERKGQPPWKFWVEALRRVVARFRALNPRGRLLVLAGLAILVLVLIGLTSVGGGGSNTESGGTGDDNTLPGFRVSQPENPGRTANELSAHMTRNLQRSNPGKDVNVGCQSDMASGDPGHNFTCDGTIANDYGYVENSVQIEVQVDPTTREVSLTQIDGP